MPAGKYLILRLTFNFFAFKVLLFNTELIVCFHLIIIHDGNFLNLQYSLMLAIFVWPFVLPQIFLIEVTLKNIIHLQIPHSIGIVRVN